MSLAHQVGLWSVVGSLPVAIYLFTPPQEEYHVTVARERPQWLAAFWSTFLLFPAPDCFRQSEEDASAPPTSLFFSKGPSFQTTPLYSCSPISIASYYVVFFVPEKQQRMREISIHSWLEEANFSGYAGNFYRSTGTWWGSWERVV